MTYSEFLENIDSFVGKVVEFNSRLKASGKVFRTQRYVWDSKEFGELKEDALIEILDVTVIRDGKLDKSVAGIVAVK